MIKALTLLYELRAEEAASPPGRRRSAKTWRREDRVYEALEKLNLDGEREEPSSEEPRPKRGRGRPKEKRPYHRRTPLVICEPPRESAAYCVKCRDRRDMEDPTLVTFTNGRAALQGTCPVCHTRIARIVKKT